MKPIALLAAAIAAALSMLSWARSLAFTFAATLGFAVYGVVRSRSKGLKATNDIPNAFRLFLASLGGGLLTLPGGSAKPALGALLVACSILLNDEYQRRVFDSLRKGRRGGSIALLGIDGSGKSSHAAALEQWVKSRGYYCTRVPFHKYLLVDRFSRWRKKSTAALGEAGGGNPLRPVLSLLDNLLLDLLSSFGRAIEGRVVVYDRYIWSTFVKYHALAYPVAPLRWLYLLPKPKCAFVLDVPVDRSVRVIHERPDHIRYRPEVLERERREYLRIAREWGCPVIDSTRDFAIVEAELESRLSIFFPVINNHGRP